MTAEELLKLYEPTQVATLEYKRQIWQARFTPCGRFLVATAYDATVQRWAVNNDGFELLEPLNGHNGWLQCMAFPGTANHVITADSWGRVSCWDYSSKASSSPVWTVAQALDGWIRTIALAPNGESIAVGGNDSRVRILSTTDGSLSGEISGLPHEIYSLAFHPGGDWLILGDLTGNVREFKTTNWQQNREFEAAGLYQLNHMQDCGGVRLLAFDQSGSRLIAGGMKEPGGGFAKGSPVLQVFDWASGKQLHELLPGDSQDGFVYDAWFHPDGFIIGTASAFPGKGKLFFWKPGDEKPFFYGNKLTNGRSISMHRDGYRLAFTSADSANANGRPLKDGEYTGGTAKIQILSLPDRPATLSS